MDFKLIWTESAIEDLGAIVRFISMRDNPALARQIGFGIYDRAQYWISKSQLNSDCLWELDPRSIHD